jgi:hypothetical protein
MTENEENDVAPGFPFTKWRFQDCYVFEISRADSVTD